MRRHKYFILLLAVVFTVLGGLALRSNHLHMVNLKETVIENDENEDFEALAENLIKLRRYVSTHIVPNFNENPATGDLHLFWGTGAFYLQKSYERAVAEAANNATSAFANQVDQTVYAQVRDICDQQFSYWSQYVDCFVTEIDKHLPADYTPPEVVMPNPSLFRLSYASPYLAWDWASFCLMIALTAYVVFFTTLCSSVISMISWKRR